MMSEEFLNDCVGAHQKSLFLSVKNVGERHATRRDPVQVLGILNSTSAFLGGAMFGYVSHIPRTFCQNLENGQPQDEVPGSETIKFV